MSSFVAVSSINCRSMNPRMAKLYAFILQHVNRKTGLFFWSRRKVCAALRISLSTYARALRELRSAGWVEIKTRFHENGSQRTNLLRVKSWGYHFRCDPKAVQVLRYGALKVYLQIARQCGKGSFAISRRSLAENCGLSMNSITRIVRQLKDLFLLRATPENRARFLGNNGQTFNRFRVLLREERIKCRRNFFRVLIGLLSASFSCIPLPISDTPQNSSPIETVRRKKPKSSIIAKLKSYTRKILVKLKRAVNVLRLKRKPRGKSTLFQVLTGLRGFLSAKQRM